MGTPLYKQLYQHILDEIISGRLQKGDRVPSEHELAEQFGVSRITSKKAFDILSQAKVIERSRGKGSFVAQTLPDLAQMKSELDEQESSSSEGRPDSEQRLIGLVLPHFAEAYGLRLLYSIEEECTKHQSHLVLKRTHGSQEEEEQAIRSLIRLGVDGLIVFPVHGEHYNAEILRLVLSGFPLVLVDRYLKGIDSYAVYTDNYHAAVALTEQLLDEGYEQIALISPPIENTTALEERFQGFSAALASRNIVPNPEYCLMSLLSTLPSSVREQQLAEDRKKLERFIVQNPQINAFVACEHSLAVLLFRLLTEMGKKMPDDYSIVCFDSLKDSLGKPLFTHILQDEQMMGKVAMDKLLNQISGLSNSSTKLTVVEYTLVQGSSTRVQHHGET
ncbi:MAG: transcriptional regulator [Paenibacillaceae bacterium]|jgi:DNA-binding LacI/PurR family transcriptional regulator/DNA-binding transcriptional regulator YhcF (GntR family)|nr:transcriptional regulator [Paenibacillaceae bacterium]